MDPTTAFVIATLMMLANGGVLGLVHRDLHAALQPAAASWRIATLLIAGGCVLFSVQQHLPQPFVLPLANGMTTLGFCGYWRALRQFYGYPDIPWLLLPPVAVAAGLYWFTAVQADFIARVLLVSAAWAVIMLGCMLTLRAPAHGDTAVSRPVMAGIILIVMAFIILRAGYFLSVGGGPHASVLNAGNWMNAVTPMIAAVLPVIGTTAFLLMCSERIRRQWERAASTDYLTGLANRRTLAGIGESRFAAAREAGDGLAVAVVDIDHFKSINDRYGHEVGDSALKHVAARLQAACRGKELPARQGGEEFVVLFERVGLAQALAAGERLRRAVESEPFATEGQLLRLTVSIGVAALDPRDGSFDDMLRRADDALYAAKAGGRNRVEASGDGPD
ncbi:GGDEF domain-containing protein [Methylogaea oryzae]|nr:GGDEF domain-containing protein [Methylogaea oryzae]